MPVGRPAKLLSHGATVYFFPISFVMEWTCSTATSSYLVEIKLTFHAWVDATTEFARLQISLSTTFLQLVRVCMLVLQSNEV